MPRLQPLHTSGFWFAFEKPAYVSRAALLGALVLGLGEAHAEAAEVAGASAGAPSSVAAQREEEKPVEAEAPASRETPAPTTLAGSFDLTRVSHHTMKNDLEILMQPLEDAPNVSVCTSLRAGSDLDPVSAPGALRVLAEILKDGGYHSPTQDYVALVESRGGVSEVEVGRQTTTYCTTMPAGELPLALWVTAGRFTAGKLTQESLKVAIDRLAREAEAQDERVLEGRAPERLRKMAFLGSYEHAHSTLPSPDDLDQVSLETVRQLHREMYVARRAKLAIVGGFQEEAAVEEFSAHLFAARPGEKEKLSPSALVAQKSGRFSMAEDHSAKTPAAWYGWVAPAGENREALDVALTALVSDKRLGGTLVGGARAAKSLDLYLDDEVAPGTPSLLRLQIVGTSSNSLGTIENGFNQQLNALVAQGMKEEELRVIQEELREKRKAKLMSSLDRAKALSRGVLLGQSSKEVLSPLGEGGETSSLTPLDVKQAAARWLDPLRRSAIEIYPKGWQDPWQVPMQKWHIVEKGQTLGSIAHLHGTSVAYLTQINSLKKNQIIYPGDKLRVPRGKATQEKPARTHQVRRGDTLSGLAVKYGVGARAIADANGMGTKLIIRTGETLVIPWGTKSGEDKPASSGPASSAPAPSTPAPGTSEQALPETSSHVVKSGETLSGIAHQHGVSTVALAQKNGISDKAMVKVGQKLLVPPRGTGKGAVSQVTYTVKSGDTLSGIAKTHGVSVKALTAENGIGRTSTLRPGQTLRIPPKE